METCCFIGLKRDSASKDIIQVTCIHDKTLPINQARKILGMRPLTIEEQEEILKNRRK